MSKVVSWMLATFNNRELAVIFWSIIIIVVAAVAVIKTDQNKFKKTFVSFLKILFSWRIIMMMILLLVWIVGEVYFLRDVGIWNVNSIKDTLIWLFGVAIAMLFNSIKAGKDNFFKKELKTAVHAIIILEFIIGLYTFSLPVELIFIPIVSSIVLLQAITETDAKYASLDRVLGWLIAIIGFMVLGFSLRAFVQNFDIGTLPEMLKELFLPILLTIGLIPFIYLFALYAMYESVFKRITWSNKQTSKRVLFFAKWKVFLAFGVNLFGLTEWSTGKWLRVNSKDDIYKLLKS